MKAKRFIAALAALAFILAVASPALAASLGVSPSHVELEVPGDSSATANFQVHYFSGDLKVSLVDIPLKIEPETLHVEASDEPVDIELTIYGDETLGSRIYDGYIRFLGMSGGSVAVGVEVKAKVTNLVEGETPVLAPPEESQLAPPAPTPKPTPVPEPATNPSAPTLPTPSPPVPETLPPRAPAPSTQNFPIIPVVGIIAATVVVVTLIVVLVRRRA